MRNTETSIRKRFNNGVDGIFRRVVSRGGEEGSLHDFCIGSRGWEPETKKKNKRASRLTKTDERVWPMIY